MENLSYNLTGAGTSIVFLHGFCESKAVWESCHAQLSDNFTIISVDLPGYGNSDSVSNLSIETMADSVFSTLAALETEKCIVVGHSMGGYVALALAEKYPELMQGLCLFHSTAYPDGAEKKLQRTKTIKYLQENGVSSFIKPFVPPLFAPQNRVKCDTAIQKLIKIGLDVPLQVIEDSAAAMRDRPDRTDVLKNANYPVLFLAGDVDATIKLEDIEAQSKLPTQSKLVVLKNTAHQGIYESEKESIGALRDFGNMIIQKK